MRLSQEAASAPAPAPVKPAASKATASARKRAPKLSWKDARELETLERRIDELEAAKAHLLEEMNATGEDYQALQSLADQLAGVEKETDAVLTRWFELSELNEAAT